MIRFATDWRAEAEHGGFYQALATGLYSRRNLNVEIRQGGPGVNVPQLLASGAAEMGIGSNSFIVMNLAAEKAPVKVVSAIFYKVGHGPVFCQHIAPVGITQGINRNRAVCNDKTINVTIKIVIEKGSLGGIGRNVQAVRGS